MEITWAMDEPIEGEIQGLAQGLQTHSVTTVFAYVSYLKAGDQFNLTFSQAANFVRNMRRKFVSWRG